MSNQNTQIEYALAVVSSMSPFNGVEILGISAGDNVVFGSIQSAPERLSVEEVAEAFSVAPLISEQLEEKEAAILASPLHGLVLNQLMERFKMADLLPHTKFQLGEAYKVVEVRNQEKEDLLLEDALGNRQWVFSGLLGIKGTLINGVKGEDIYAARRAPRH